MPQDLEMQRERKEFVLIMQFLCWLDEISFIVSDWMQIEAMQAEHSPHRDYIRINMKNCNTLITQ